ncbi:MAG: hypothetical protein R3E39_24455 [Anaerolineae bacterium]
MQMNTGTLGEHEIRDVGRLRVMRPFVPRSVVFAWLLHVIISLVFGFTVQANPETTEAQWFSTPDWAGNLAHWDVNWEIRISDQGYGPDFSPQTSAKFPLAALTARLIHQVLHVPMQVALFLINKAGLLLGLWALWRMVAGMSDIRTADRAVRFMAFPLLGTAFIYWMSYPDVLFLAWWALAFTCLWEGNYLRAGLIATLAVWTRPQGAVLVGVMGLSVLVEAARNKGLFVTLRSGVFWRHVLAACIIPVLGLVGWIIRVSDVAGIPFSPYVAQGDVGRGEFIWPWERIVERVQWMANQSEPLNGGYWTELWQLALIMLGLVILIVVWRRGKLRWELVLFSVLSIGLPLATGVMAIGRFATMTWLPLAFMYIIPARWRWLDGVLWLVGVGLAVAVLTNINLTPSDWYYVP